MSVKTLIFWCQSWLPSFASKSLRYDTAYFAILTLQLQTSIVWQCNWVRPNFMTKSWSTLNFAPERASETFWGALFLEDSPPKIPTFSGSDSERLKRGSQCSAQRRSFQKPLRTIAVMRIDYNPTGRNDTSSQYPRCPMQEKTKKWLFCPTWGGFWVSVAGHRGFWEEVPFHFSIPHPIRRTQTVGKGFWKFNIRAEIWGRFCWPFGTKSEKIIYFREQIWKLGGKVFPLNIFSASGRLKI